MVAQAVLDPVTFNSQLDHGLLQGLADDDHTQYALLAGRAGGQTLTGDTANGGALVLEGSSGANPGFINANSPIIFGPYAGNPSAAYGFSYTATETFASGFVGGGLNFSGNITHSGGTFIYESFRGAPTITTNGNPGFAAYTVLQALPTFNAGPGAGHHPLSPLIVNAGATCSNGYSGTRTVGSIQGLNMGSGLQTTVSGAVLNCGDFIGVNVAPVWSTVSGSTINFGNITGVNVARPAQRLFGGSGGIERANSFHGLKVANPGINNGFGTMPCSAVRSEITIGTNRYFMLNAGTAPSDMGASHMYFDDNFGIAFGGNGITNFDSWISWDAINNKHRTYFFNTARAIFQDTPNLDRYRWAGSGGNGVSEFTFDCHKFSLGAQAGSNGNQIGSFVAGTRATTLAGEWSDFINTSAANITINHAMGLVAGWTVNAPSITLGTGTVTTAGALNIGGNVNQGSVNRFGVRILSNPSGGSGVNAALWVTAGNTQLDGDLNHTGTNLGFYGTAAIAKQLAVPVTAAGVHAALVALGLIT